MSATTWTYNAIRTLGRYESQGKFYYRRQVSVIHINFAHRVFDFQSLPTLRQNQAKGRATRRMGASSDLDVTAALV